MTTMSRRAARFAALVLFASVSGAAAQEPRPPLDASALRQAAATTARACGVDARRYCRGAPDIAACLWNSPNVSGVCKDALAAAAPVFSAVSTCQAEATQLCASVPQGGGRVVGCLADYYAQLSPTCYSALAAGAEAYRQTY